ncbi:Glycosyl transferases group 1 [Blastococcus sp. DSM 46786]|uniref:glycosyltransferase n=1 Tax=Blastococcus sp. DSM 46786 TaxID=1798227 RepID=UPI0008D68396|nr:glycosyltransferase [Blastococcus sp. DSM 46786]SEL64523.1 Glycosyl transferases group 1 [Blastococcus sp. DSM 46786]
MIEPRKTGAQQPAYALYLAVIPSYRRACVSILRARLGHDLEMFASDAHLDVSVRTGIPEDQYRRTGAHRLFGSRLLVQTGHWRRALGVRSLIIDLNPRSITAWMLLITRRLLGRRVIVWGHLHPQAGGDTRLAVLRRTMRRLAHGTVLYGYDSVRPARAELPSGPLWVAPNSLYQAADMRPASPPESPNLFLYVGRLEPDKDVGLLLDAFADSDVWRGGFRLAIVGFGSQADQLKERARKLGISDHVDFLGRIEGPDALRGIYGRTLWSVSPGYVGLTLTQSLGFGVPILIPSATRHSPEVELQRFGGVQMFERGREGLAVALRQASNRRFSQENAAKLSHTVAQYYTAEAMAEGLMAAFEGRWQELGEDGWGTISA